MKNITGIWINNFTEEEARKMLSQGFNGILLPFNPYYSYYRPNINYAIREYHNTYLRLQKLGCKEFLLEAGSWGINELDAIWELVSDKFDKDKHNMAVYHMYAGEFPEQFYERQEYKQANNGKCWSRTEVAELMRRRLMYDNTFKFDCTARNYDYFSIAFQCELAISSYWGQHKLWNKDMPFVWIYGQLKIGGSLRYKTLKKHADKHNITKFYLYQGDPIKFDIKNPTTYLTWIFPKTINTYLRKRFIKIFR
jgi:hypothetical protein